jgi:predicted DNA-binding protein with PD1-like motif
MSHLPLRLPPGADLRAALAHVLHEQSQQAGFVLAGIGSLARTRLRLAGASEALALDGDVEILGLSGSVSPDGVHLHMSVADAQGRVWGGHVLPGCVVRTTAELLLALLPGWQFSRAPDPDTGYAELLIRRAPGA